MMRPLPALTAVPLTLAGLLNLSCEGCSRAIREKALREHSVSMCGSVPHEAGSACATEVARRFHSCSPAFLEQKISSETYARCLGFVVSVTAAGTATATSAGSR